MCIVAVAVVVVVAPLIAGAKFHADVVHARARARASSSDSFNPIQRGMFFRFARLSFRTWARLRVVFSQKEVRGPLTQRPKRFRQLVTSANKRESARARARCVPMRSDAT